MGLSQVVERGAVGGGGGVAERENCKRSSIISFGGLIFVVPPGNFIDWMDNS